MGSCVSSLNEDEARRVLNDGTYGPAVLADNAEAHRLGITGVSFFLIDGRYGVPGAQPPQIFTAAFDAVWPAPTPVAPDGRADRL